MKRTISITTVQAEVVVGFIKSFPHCEVTHRRHKHTGDEWEISFDLVWEQSLTDEKIREIMEKAVKDSYADSLSRFNKLADARLQKISNKIKDAVDKKSEGIGDSVAEVIRNEVREVRSQVLSGYETLKDRYDALTEKYYELITKIEEKLKDFDSL